MSENAIIGYNNWLSGDENGLDALIAEYNKRLIFYIGSITGCVSSAEDAAADAFMKLLLKKPKFKDEYSLSSWLFKTARNCAIDYVRKNSKVVLSDFQKEENERDFEELDSLLIKDEKKRILRKSLDSLKNEYREILILIYFEEKSYSDISRITGKKEKQIKNLAYRARNEMREILERNGFIYEN